MIRRIYITYRERLSPVLESQILLPASLSSGSTSVWISMLPFGQIYRSDQKSKLQHWREMCNRLGVETQFLPTGPSRFATRAWDRWLLGRAIKRYERQSEQSEIWSRGASATELVLSLKLRSRQKSRITFDCRGDEVAEIMAARGRSIMDRTDWTAEDSVVFERSMKRESDACQADQISVVTKQLQKVLESRHLVTSGKFSIRPCVVDLRRFPEPNKILSRTQLGINDRFVVCYLGSLEWYQQPDRCVSIFKEIASIRSNALFLAITTHAEKMQKHLAEAGIESSDFRVLTASHDNVHQLVGTADIGLLLRERHPVNEVASPIKFAEMMACGLPVVISDHIGDSSSWVNEHELGCVLSTDLSVSDQNRNLKAFLSSKIDWNAMSKRCRDFAVNKLSWQAQLSIGV